VPWHRTFPQGAEVFIVRGDITANERTFGQGAWLYIPPGTTLQGASPHDCRLYGRSGGAAHLDPPGKVTKYLPEQ
jgi:hypothetical protein